MSSRRQMLEFLSLSRLPAEFQEVEYLESTGTQCIDTGIIPTGVFEIEIKTIYNTHSSSGAKAPFGIYGASTSIYAGLLYQNKLQYFIGNSGFISYFDNFVYNTEYKTFLQVNYSNKHISIKNNDIELVNTQISSLVSTNSTLYLFGANNSGQLANVLYGKIKNSIILIDSVIVRNFIPCYRKADNEPGLYDLVNGVFYTNAGTGTFIVGGNV